MRRRPLLLFIGLCACTPSGDASGEASSAQLTELSEKLDRANEDIDRINQRLDSIDAKLKQIEQAQREPPRPPLRLDSAVEDPPPSTVDPETIAAGIHCEGERCTLKRELVDELLSTPEALARSVRIVPAVREGKTVGFKLYGLRNNSIGDLLGFKNGDLVRSIGGRRIDSVDAAIEAYEALRGVDEIVFELERKGEARTLTLRIE